MKVYDDTHVFPISEEGEHEVFNGPTGCHCEPEVDSKYDCDCGHFVRRVIIHQEIARACPARLLVGCVGGRHNF